MSRPSLPRALSSIVAGAITFFVLAVGLFGFLLQDALAPTVASYAGLYPDMPRFILLFLGDALWAALLFVLLCFQSPNSLWAAARTGAFVMALVGASNVVHDLATTNLLIGSPLLLLDVLGMSLIGAAVAVVMCKIGLVE
ncbi:MAG: hypothetical protein AAFR75_05080 [Pseudomonadota bacterium]